MLKNVTGQETDTFDEVNKVLNKLITNQNRIEERLDANDAYNAEVDKYNESLLKKSKPKKKGGK